MKKAAGFLGLGTECVFSVKTDDKGRLIPKDLEKQIDKAAAEVSQAAKEIRWLERFRSDIYCGPIPGWC